ncbi:hypothetical protein C8Q76DRAFT_802498 [Earliella scabrosa]|nr:hypothetical protein C8Q76DRAFT_802498 [Earliella scabrosa]
MRPSSLSLLHLEDRSATTGLPPGAIAELQLCSTTHSTPSQYVRFPPLAQGVGYDPLEQQHWKSHPDMIGICGSAPQSTYSSLTDALSPTVDYTEITLKVTAADTAHVVEDFVPFLSAPPSSSHLSGMTECLLESPGAMRWGAQSSSWLPSGRNSLPDDTSRLCELMLGRGETPKHHDEGTAVDAVAALPTTFDLYSACFPSAAVICSSVTNAQSFSSDDAAADNGYTDLLEPSSAAQDPLGEPHPSTQSHASSSVDFSSATEDVSSASESMGPAASEGGDQLASFTAAAGRASPPLISSDPRASIPLAGAAPKGCGSTGMKKRKRACEDDTPTRARKKWFRSLSVNAGFPVTDPDRISAHERKRTYLESLEEYILWLEDQVRLAGLQPVEMERISTYREMEAKSMGTILFHQVEVLRGLHTRNQEIKTEHQHLMSAAENASL